MTNNIQWTVISHDDKQPQNNPILVGYVSNGKYFSDVCAISPLYDLRDMNLDGSADWTEKIWNSATKFKDPDHVFAVIKSMGPASCVMDVAIQMNDYQLKNESIQGVLESVFDICVESLVASLMPAVIHNLAIKPTQKAAAAAGFNTANNVYGGALFLLKIGMGADIRESLISLGMQPHQNGLGLGGH